MKNLELTCVICDISYDKRDSYRAHMRNRHGENFAKCNIICSQNCDKKFFSIARYREHLQKDHQIPMVKQVERFATEHQFYE